ncbi:hypothetical protein ABZ442_05060 [Streptomyces triculaminicus]|uniref:hypothetical protein n=1 Tax=Streptomyces triculaminicus TaxID=2816232 RepID=UPI00340A51FF
MTEIRVALIRPDQPPSFHHTDIDGDRLMVTTADIPGTGPGLYFRTDPDGSSLPLADLPALIEQLNVIAEAARRSCDAACS